MNAVTITVLGSVLEHRIRVQDTGAVLQTGAALYDGSGCTAIDEHTADCTASRSLSTRSVDLADGDDTATTPDASGLSGGEGNDTLTLTSGQAEGGPGDDVIACGSPPNPAPSPCSLDGGPGRDQVSGGVSNDSLSGGRGTDALDGGEGADTLDYSDHQASVFVDLDAAVQVARVAGTPEPISGFEAAYGGSGNDILISPTSTFKRLGLLRSQGMIGGAGDDRISVGSGIPADGGDGDDRITGSALNFFLGGEGNDRLTGGRQGDTLRGGPGRDILDGKAGRDDLRGDEGNDVLRGGRGAAKDRVDCGPGRRDRAQVDGKDRVTRCERLTLKRSA